jgi:IS1 family transposase
MSLWDIGCDEDHREGHFRWNGWRFGEAGRAGTTDVWVVGYFEKSFPLRAAPAILKSCQSVKAPDRAAVGYNSTRYGALFTPKNVTPAISAKHQAAGDAWLWVATDVGTKLVPCWSIGSRDAVTARDFVEDLAGRLKNRVQLTTDGLKLYQEAADNAYGGYIDYSMLVRIYGSDAEGEKRNSRAKRIGCETHAISEGPGPRHVSTSSIDRRNLGVRMRSRRFTRSTNAFSKKIENHIAAVAPGYFAYNYTKIHRTLRVTPAMAAGVTDRLWEFSDLVSTWEARERRLETQEA